jgi:predicted Mrr-cat superfamily restriction endonuclease
MKQTIPRRIRIGQKEYSIEVVEALLDKRLAGEINYHERLIQVGMRNGRTGRLFNPAFVHDTFWHELVHAILDDMDEDKLNRNEKFVTAFATRLAQAIRTARF